MLKTLELIITQMCLGLLSQLKLVCGFHLMSDRNTGCLGHGTILWAFPSPGAVLVHPVCNFESEIISFQVFKSRVEMQWLYKAKFLFLLDDHIGPFKYIANH